MTTWRETTLGEVILLQRGFDLTQEASPPGPYPVISSSGTGYTTAVSKVEGPGVITGRKGVLGKVHFAPGPYWPHDTTLWVKDFKGSDPRFIYYLLHTLPLASLDAGASNPTLNRNHAHLLPVRVPDPATQRRVSAILGAIDDLIENNRRRIELLERVAQVIYREWFVHFRYPGHEAAVMVDSPLGPIPEGWTIKTVGELSTNFDRLRKPLSKVDRDERSGSFPYYGAAKLIDWIDDWIFDGEYLLFAEDGSVQTYDGLPVLQLVEGRFWANNHTHILQGRGVSTRFLYLASAVHPISGYVTGAAQPKITQANLNRIPLIVAQPSVQDAFDKAIDPIFSMWNLVKASTAPLKAVVDLLLPKLVSGQIDVSQLDIDELVDSVA